jgi:hypothetical protein
MSMPPPQPPRPPRVFRRHVVLHLALTLLTVGLWGPVWVVLWWTVDARNSAEEQRYRREWSAYQEALVDWRWRYSLAFGAPPPNWDAPDRPLRNGGGLLDVRLRHLAPNAGRLRALAVTNAP